MAENLQRGVSPAAAALSRARGTGCESAQRPPGCPGLIQRMPWQELSAAGKELSYQKLAFLPQGSACLHLFLTKPRIPLLANFRMAQAPLPPSTSRPCAPSAGVAAGAGAGVGAHRLGSAASPWHGPPARCPRQGQAGLPPAGPSVRRRPYGDLLPRPGFSGLVPLLGTGLCSSRTGSLLSAVPLPGWGWQARGAKGLRSSPCPWLPSCRSLPSAVPLHPSLLLLCPPSH